MRFGLGLAVAHFSSPGLEDGETGSATMTETFTMAVAGTEAGETGSQTDTEVFTMSIASTEADEAGASGNVVTMSIASTEANETGSATETEVFTMAIAGTEAGETSAATMLNNPIPGLTGLQFYVDASITAPHVSSASNIDLWSDLSGNANHLNTLPTGVSAPQKGGDNSLGVTAASSRGIVNPGASRIGTGHYCVALVIKVDALVDQGILFGDTDLSTGGVDLKIVSNKWVLDHYNVAAGANTSTADAPTDAFHVVIWDRATGAAPVFYLDGSSQSLSGSTTSNPVGAAATFGGICMGTFGNFNSNFSSCKILSAFICNSDIGSTLAGAVRSYWKQVYGTP